MLEIPVRSEQEDEFLHMLFPRINKKTSAEICKRDNLDRIEVIK